MVDYTGQQLGNYQLTRLLGEGGFAQVYLGEHIYLDTQAAIKVLNPQVANDLDWFRTEARTIARLVHPNIVRVLEFGVESNTPFLVLDYASNGTLRQRHPRGTVLPLPTVVSYVKQVAEALQYAHDEKLIHRDVKPENMLLGKSNEVLLSDFGVALMSQTLREQSLQNVAGTLLYMAPEQIQGYPRRASDQYSLGIIVYEWLAGQRPFEGSLTEIISQQLAVSPLPLRAKMPTVVPAIEQVVMTALEKDPDKRFDSVRAFALALEQASQLDTLTSEQAGKSAVAGKAAVTFPSAKRPVASLVSEGVPVVAPPVLSPSALIMQAKPAGTVVCSYRGHVNAVRSLSWPSDGMRIVSASNDKMVHIWDAMTGNKLQIYQDTSDAVRVVAGSSNGSRIATAGADTLIRVWDFATNRLVSTYRGHLGNEVNAMAWSPKQQLLASAATDGTVHVWDATTGQPLTIYRGHAGSVNTLAWSPDESSPLGRGYRIVSGSDDTSVQTWEASTGRIVAFYRGQPVKVLSVAWSPNVYASTIRLDSASNAPNSSRVACGREDGMLQMWDTTTDREVLSYRYSAPTSVIAWSPDGRRFAYASDNKTVEVWDTRTNLKLLTFSHLAPPRVMAWSPDGKYIASGGGDTTIQVWVAP